MKKRKDSVLRLHPAYEKELVEIFTMLGQLDEDERQFLFMKMRAVVARRESQETVDTKILGSAESHG
jgi:hypothetical protein